MADNSGRRRKLCTEDNALDELRTQGEAQGTLRKTRMDRVARSGAEHSTIPSMERAVDALAGYGESLAQAARAEQAPASELFENFTSALKEVRESYRTEREVLMYQLDQLKDSQSESLESHSQLQREYREKCKELDAVKREQEKVAEELRLVHGQLKERDELIANLGYMIVTVENEDGTDAHRELVGTEHGPLLESASGSLNDYLTKFTIEKEALQKRLDAVKKELQDQRGKVTQMNEFYQCVLQEDEIQWENVKKAIDHYKAYGKDRDIENGRLLTRLRISEWKAETSEDQFEITRQKLVREKREAELRADELQTENQILQARLDNIVQDHQSPNMSD